MTPGRSSGSTVERLMTRSPVVVGEDEQIAAVAGLLAGFEISGLPVVDSGDHLVGVISQTDLFRLRGSTLPWTGWHGPMVRDVMSTPAKTIAGSSALDAAARRPLSRVAKAAVVLEILLSIGALGGGLVLMIAPRGEIMPLPLSALAGSPFDTYLVPGLILFCVLGLGPLVAARLAWLRHPLAPTAAFVVGAGLLIWVAVEVAIIGYSNEPPLQAIYGLLGVAIVFVAVRWLLGGGLPRLDRMPPRRSDDHRTSI